MSPGASGVLPCRAPFWWVGGCWSLLRAALVTSSWWFSVGWSPAQGRLSFQLDDFAAGGLLPPCCHDGSLPDPSPYPPPICPVRSLPPRPCSPGHHPVNAHSLAPARGHGRPLSFLGHLGCAPAFPMVACLVGTCGVPPRLLCWAAGAGTEAPAGPCDWPGGQSRHQGVRGWAVGGLGGGRIQPTALCCSGRVVALEHPQQQQQQWWWWRRRSQCRCAAL